MQEEERIHAISKLKSITRSQHSDRAIRELQKHTNPRFFRSKNDLSSTRNNTERYLDQSHKTQEYIEDETEDHIEDETEEHIENTTEEHIEDETEDHIENETEEHIENETEDHIEDEHDDD